MHEKPFLISSHLDVAASRKELSVRDLERHWHAYLADEGQVEKCSFYCILAVGPGSDHVDDDRYLFVDVQIATVDGHVQFTLMLSIDADVWFLKRVDGLPLWFRWTATGFRGTGDWEDDAGFVECARPWEVGVIRFLEVFGPQHVFPLAYFSAAKLSHLKAQDPGLQAEPKKHARRNRTVH